MNAFSQYPFVRILIPFLLGICTDILWNWNDAFTLFLFAFFFLIYVADYLTVNLLGRFEFRFYNGIYLSALLFLTGSFWISVTDDRKSESHYLNSNNEGIFVVQVIRDAVIKENSVKLEVKMISRLEEKKFLQLYGKAILYLEKEENAQFLKYGDEILVKTKWKEIDSPKNPGEFDYKNYLQNKRIYSQGYSDHFHWKKVGEGGNSVYRWAMQSRNKLLSILKNAGLKDQEFAVASALILGYTDEINQEVKTAYSASGALHVLSVSGLHVAIIFAVFDKLLFFLLRFKKGHYLKAIFILFILWGYAFLTGLSPSVMRSAAMLSFVVVGKMINRNASIYNILCASAFVLLIFDPLLILDVGFQLSYLAVFGIVFLHPKIYGWFYFKNRIIDFVWNVTAVSLAAQLATFPIGLFYFHQFPNYFLLSNLIVIPLGTIILYNGILALVFSFVPGLNDLLIFTLKWLVRFLNESVMWMERLPYSVSDSIFISAFTCFLLYMICFSFCFYFIYKKRYWFKISLTGISLLFSIFSWNKWNHLSQTHYTVYCVPDHTAVDFIEGNNHYFIADSNLLTDEFKINFHVKNNWGMQGLKNSEKKEFVFEYQNYYAFHHQRILKIDSAFHYFKPIHKLKLDVILVTENSKLRIEEINEMYDYEIIIIDASNEYYRLNYWRKQRKKEKRIILLQDTGALTFKV